MSGQEQGPGPVVEFWTIQDLAAWLRKPVSWVYAHYRDLYPYYRVGREVRFDPEEIRAAMAERYRHDPRGN